MGREKTIRTPLRQRLARARVGALPLLVWIVAVALSIELWLVAPTAPTYSGLAFAQPVRVTSPIDGSLEDLLVDLFQTVGAGEPLATLDESGLDASLATARAEVERLAAELEAQRAQIEDEAAAAAVEVATRVGLARSMATLEHPAELRAFHDDEAGLRLAALRTRLELTTTELEADRLEVRLARARTMAASDLGPRVDAEDFDLRLKVERGRAEELRRLESQQRAELEGFRQRRESLLVSYAPFAAAEFPAPRLDQRVAGLRAAIVVQERRVDELMLRRRCYVLRAPVAGRVALLAASQGQFLLAGEPILELLDAEAAEVALWVPETTIDPPRLGARLAVAPARSARAGERAECVVLAISPRVELMPERLWRDLRVAEYGRAYLLGPLASLGLAPGERVRVEPLPKAP